MGDGTADATWLRAAEDLPRLERALAKASWLALDTESNSMHVYRERICLVQLNLSGECFLLDPLALPRERGALGPLAEALERPELPVFLHGGEYDVICLRRDYGIAVRGVRDSHQGARLLGLPKTGYAHLVARFCGVDLPKAWTAYDWSSRPLDEKAVAYALDDVRYLPAVITAVGDAIEAADLEEEFAIANRTVETAEGRGPDFDPTDVWRLSGVGRLRRERLGVLVALHAWRDRIARAADRPPGRMVNQRNLVQLAATAPTNFGGLKRLRLPARLLRAHGEELLAVIKEARRSPPPIPPAPHRRRPEPDERRRETRLKRWRREEAERRGVTELAVLPPRALDHLVRNGAEDLAAVPQLGEKRSRLYGDALRRLLTGDGARKE